MYKNIVLLIFLLTSALSWSQTDQEKLEQRKAQIQEEIRAQERLLESQNSKQKSVSTVIAQQTEKINEGDGMVYTDHHHCIGCG